MEEACCTCATLLSDVSPLYDEKTEKPSATDRRLDCCSRVICGPCITVWDILYALLVTTVWLASNESGPFCQVSTVANPLPKTGHDPPAYTYPDELHATSSPPRYDSIASDPPRYDSSTDTSATTEKSSMATTSSAEDVLHFVDHGSETLAGLSLRYNVPIAALRRTNALTSDHLFGARRTLLIPGEYYKGGVSLSPRPLEGEEEEARRNKIRRWMVACKVAEYDVALLYLQEAQYDLDAAVEAFKEDEIWEKEHPLVGSGKGKGRTQMDAGRKRFTGQKS